MSALIPALVSVPRRRRLIFLHAPFAASSLQPYPACSRSSFDSSRAVRDSPPQWQASPFPSRLAHAAYRIEFTCLGRPVWGRIFASGCSPPRIAAAQLPPATVGFLSPDAFRLSLTGFMAFDVALGARLARARARILLASRTPLHLPIGKPWGKRLAGVFQVAGRQPALPA